MTKVCARWVSRQLSELDKQRRMETSNDLLDLYDADPELYEARIITEDESWLHHIDRETKTQCMELKTGTDPTPIKFRGQASAGKVLASIFWDTQGVMLVDFLPKGETITGT